MAIPSKRGFPFWRYALPKRSDWESRLRYVPSWWSFGGWMLFVGLFVLFSLQERLSFPRPLIIDTSQVEVNTADSLRLLSLPGLSPWKVSRLMHIRRTLRGFWDTSEVRLVCGEETWVRIACHVKVMPLQQPPSLPINLNTVDSVSLVKEGLCRPSAAQSFIRFRKRHLMLTDWAQLDSIYGLNVIEKYRLRRYGHLGRIKTTTYSMRAVDINRASPEILEKLPGIGLVTARRIVKYRERLRYFISLDQLKEVRGVRAENLSRALPYLYVGPPLVPPLSLREATAEELAAHPYISWKLARYLIEQRQKWGSHPIPPHVWHEWIPDSLRPFLIPYLRGE
ncbi:MAG: helix-hairpin-helix domain-containing protein [Bacteroidia bacterium]|nr:helix-hairpin-helix domain-containing protein [Bacteroidia bacterium]MDW8014617.1 helix-hairpin-helix domain-containing protein [Bacteroidia bacterium]